MTVWIKTKNRLPPPDTKVMARNPHCEAVSWINGLNELGKPDWRHETWEHADDYVVEWRLLSKKELYKYKQYCEICERPYVDCNCPCECDACKKSKYAFDLASKYAGK